MDMNMPGMNMPGMNMGAMPGMNMQSTPSRQGSGSPAVLGRAELTVPSDVQQRIGVTIGQVEMAPLRMSVRAVGIVRSDETKVSHVHLKTEGWVEELYIDFTGKEVKRGEKLLAIYSPDFMATQQEYLNALQAGQQSLAEFAQRRLELWGVSREEVGELEKTRQPHKNLILRNPRTGTVLMKNAFEGQRVSPQDELYVVADLSTIWVQARVYEYELPHVVLGQQATVTIPALPGREYAGKVVFIQPTLDEATRTVQVRVELPNQDGQFKPGMFANIEIHHTMGEGLLVPTAAVIRAGEQDVAFRVQEANRFVPVEVKIDTVKFGDRFHVLKGLKAGDRVVTSANFLIDSESRLRLGGGDMAGMPGMGGMDMGGMKGTDHSKMKHPDHGLASGK